MVLCVLIEGSHAGANGRTRIFPWDCQRTVAEKVRKLLMAASTAGCLPGAQPDQAWFNPKTWKAMIRPGQHMVWIVGPWGREHPPCPEYGLAWQLLLLLRTKQTNGQIWWDELNQRWWYNRPTRAEYPGTVKPLSWQKPLFTLRDLVSLILVDGAPSCVVDTATQKLWDAVMLGPPPFHRQPPHLVVRYRADSLPGRVEMLGPDDMEMKEMKEFRRWHELGMPGGASRSPMAVAPMCDMEPRFANEYWVCPLTTM